MRLALYQPDIPQNTGAAMRLCACMGVGLDLIEPFGFIWNEQKIKKSGMDYINLVDYRRHESWDKFNRHYQGKQRIILMTTKTDIAYTTFEFRQDDIIMAGRESAGVPKDIHEAVDHAVTIPMHGQARSLNVINACSMILGEALRQTRP